MNKLFYMSLQARTYFLFLEEGRRLCDVEIIQFGRLGNPSVALPLSLTY